MISIKEILKYMESGKVFSMKVIAYDRKRKTGGQIKEYPEAILTQAPKPDRSLTKVEQQKLELDRLRKNPHHREHYTRNITICQEGQPTSIIHTIHPPLIIEFNGDIVVP